VATRVGAAVMAAAATAGRVDRSINSLRLATIRIGRDAMRRATLNIKESQRAIFAPAAFAMILAAGCFPQRSMGQQPGEKTFSSPEEAGKALVAAIQNNDEKAMLDVLGAAGKQVISSGDETEDADSRANFLRRYAEMHRFVKEPDGTTTLYIGVKNWPTPIPLMNKASFWYFDTDAGMKEILFRRIGRNEISTIRVCQELAAAEKEFHETQRGEYAEKVVSDEGKHNGLYWQAAAGERQSPIGPLVALAFDQGYAGGDKRAATPYRGYFFRVLTQQGKHAPGSAKSYIANGEMTQGFAFVAYPAEYRTSGVMTFIVGNDGVVYQKDIGANTRAVAETLKTYDPDATWRKAQDDQP
jgi:hypothetical protein